MKNINIVFHFSLLFPLFFISCKKDWLDAKPNKSLVVPSKIEDYQALIDNYDLFNVDQPELGELASDNYYLTFPKWQTLQSIEQKVYVWDEDPYQGQSNLDWQYAYVRILNSNVILEGINKINQLPSLSEAWNNVKGSALFYR